MSEAKPENMLKALSGKDLLERMDCKKVVRVQRKVQDIFQAQTTLHEALAVSTLLIMDCIQNYELNWESEDLKNAICVEVTRVLDLRFNFVGSHPPTVGNA
jgi:hypothetical protein